MWSGEWRMEKRSRGFSAKTVAATIFCSKRPVTSNKVRLEPSCYGKCPAKLQQELLGRKPVFRELAWALVSGISALKCSWAGLDCRPDSMDDGRQFSP
jgi:hypothetical protein